MTSFETGVEKDSGQVVYKQTDLQHFTFKVKGKGPAHVVLQEHYHTDRVYEFTIGDDNNEKTTIRKWVCVPPTTVGFKQYNVRKLSIFFWIHTVYLNFQPVIYMIFPIWSSSARYQYRV